MSQRSTVDKGGPRADGMPMLSLGTWQNGDSDACANAVETALEAPWLGVPRSLDDVVD